VLLNPCQSELQIAKNIMAAATWHRRKILTRNDMELIDTKDIDMA